jgi:acyl-CoA synthetase (AMP-forming)/AMP-acid ligase II
VNLAATGESARECVSSGKPLDGCEIRIVDDRGAEVAKDMIGEITIRSPYMFSGYRNNPEATQSALKGDWYSSGDYGFLYDGECYVIGRKKDIIIVAGKNIYPEDIEAQISRVDGVLPGRVVAFGVFDDRSGTEQVWIAAETDRDEPLQNGLRIDIVKAAMEIDVTISKVVFVPPRWLIKSSAGKPSRRANTERILSMHGAK